MNLRGMHVGLVSPCNAAKILPIYNGQRQLLCKGLIDATYRRTGVHNGMNLLNFR